MGVIEALILGLVQGLTEFLPVSSSGHLVLAGRLLGVNSQAHDFEAWLIWLHLATLTAVGTALWREIRDTARSLLPGAPAEIAKPGRALALGLIIGTLPAVLVALTAKDAIDAAFTSVRLVGADLLLTAVVLAVSRGLRGGHAPVTPLRALLIGTAQALAILPGVSRSGMTLVAGLALGLSPATAVRFSFLLAVPAILGAVVLDLDALRAAWAGSPVALAAGFLSAAVSGYLAIRIVWRVMERGRLAVFAPYCAVLGIIALIVGGAVAP